MDDHDQALRPQSPGLQCGKQLREMAGLGARPVASKSPPLLGNACQTVHCVHVPTRGKRRRGNLISSMNGSGCTRAVLVCL